MISARFLSFSLALCSIASASSQAPERAEFIEPDFLFFSSVLDARDLEPGNLTPRGLILNLGDDLWACFDTELLRLAAVWKGEEGKPPVTPEALAPGSYHVAGQKTKDGQDYLPKLVGKPWVLNGVYPGLQTSNKPQRTDPREPAPSPEEVGRGPLANARFDSIAFTPDGVALRMTVEGVRVLQRLRSLGDKVELTTVAAPAHKPLSLILGKHVETMRISGAPRVSVVHLTAEGVKSVSVQATGPSPNGKRRWPQAVTTKAHIASLDAAYVNDRLELPVINPWKRNVRLADIAFLNDKGDAAVVSFDGDVWKVSGLTGDLNSVVWQRFASGLHEPMSIVSRRGEIFVFDRNGIWKLVDSDNNGEADVHELFCNLFAQTAETREFPNSMKLGPNGEFFLSKGGQEGSTRGKHNGTVIKVSADGKKMDVIGYGLRQPFIGVNELTGMVTASDQQGNYVPSTPIQVIADHQFYGHLPTIAEKEAYPEKISEPMVWIPHPVNPSGATQAWLVGSKMGPIDGEMIHVGYNRPEIFRVLINERFERKQAAVMSFSRDFDFGPLNAHVNPADGQLYVIGFQVWGTTAKELSGITRVRYTNRPRPLLKQVTPTDKGLLLKFNMKLDAKLATDPASYSAERWNYRRTHDYGSPHLKTDGATGQEWMVPSSAYLSKDGLSVLVGLPQMKEGVHQMRIGWGLKTEEGLKAENTAYFTPWELIKFDSEKEGFGKIEVDLTPRKAVAVAESPPSAEDGKRFSEMFGCMACHSIDGTTVGKVGPTWKDLYGSMREIGKGQKGKFKADDAYLRESITNPTAKVVKGFEKFDTGMPIYAGILTPGQIESLILYIKSLAQ
ncbi:MAG: c-type cytochrome [Verrucomicrobiaceae bacterium]|nr:c-type cytochrome [Verrucomicrobiaceae bacterium]